MDDLKERDTQSVVTEVLSGIKGETVFNTNPSRLMPLLTFRDAVPEAVKAEMNMSTPAQGQMLDPWVTRRPNGQ